MGDFNAILQQIKEIHADAIWDSDEMAAASTIEIVARWGHITLKSPFHPECW